MTPEDAERFFRDNLAFRSPPALPSIRLLTAHTGSGLRRLTGDAAPYWAFPWPGGVALALYLLERPQTVVGKRVLDFGCGGGLVGIAAAQAGAAEVRAADADPLARMAAKVNAEANGVSVTVLPGNPESLLPGIDLVAAGDVFYSRAVARRSLRFLGACQARGIEVLVGDPGRKPLPHGLLAERARYAVADFGNVPADGIVFSFREAFSFREDQAARAGLRERPVASP